MRKWYIQFGMSSERYWSELSELVRPNLAKVLRVLGCREGTFTDIEKIVLIETKKPWILGLNFDSGILKIPRSLVHKICDDYTDVAKRRCVLASYASLPLARQYKVARQMPLVCTLRALSGAYSYLLVENCNTSTAAKCGFGFDEWRRAGIEWTITQLTGACEVEAAKAAHWFKSCRDLSVLGILQKRFQSAPAFMRRSITAAYRSVARNAYPTEYKAALCKVKRNTYEGRLRQVDFILGELLAAWRGGQKEAFGANLTYFCPVGRSLSILEHAVSDGTTALELAIKLQKERFDARVVGLDVAMKYSEWVDAAGSCYFRDFAGRFLPSTGLLPETVGKLRKVADHRFLSPEVVEYTSSNPDRLYFDSGDVLEVYRSQVDIVRAFGLLYWKLHDCADSDSYFDVPTLEKAVHSIGASLRPGGIAIIGNLVDSRCDSSSFFDVELWQRGVEDGGVFSRRMMWGLGLGLRCDHIRFPDAAEESQ